MVLSDGKRTHYLGFTFVQGNLDLIVISLIRVFIFCLVILKILVNWFVVILTKHDESFAKRDIVLRV
jgi:hypothetical protein